MEALTVRRPWAGLMIWYGKGGTQHPPRLGTENRSQVTHYRGPLLIHAGAAYEDVAWPTASAVLGLARYGDAVTDPRLDQGGVIGMVDVVGCCTASRHLGADDSLRCACGPWAMPGFMHWKLANARALAEPVVMAGSQGRPWHAPHDLAWWTDRLAQPEGHTTHA